MEPEPEPEPEPRDEPATGRAGAVGGSSARPPQMAIDRRLEAVLRDQIERLADPRANFEMHRWWNWDPDGPWDPEGGSAHCRHDGPPPAGEWVDTAPAQCMEVVVADLHDRVIESCREWFARANSSAPNVNVQLVIPPSTRQVWVGTRQNAHDIRIAVGRDLREYVSRP
eukprot:COSAG03_NODE_1212_length_4546_cov_2.416685_2_plen_169_part_00